VSGLLRFYMFKRISKWYIILIEMLLC